MYEEAYDKGKLTNTQSTAFLSLPGKQGDAEAPDREKLVDRKVEAGLRALLAGKRACGECHTDKEGNNLSVASTSIAKSDVPDIWFTHARFDHDKHTAEPRNIDCKVCHKAAYPSGEKHLLEAYGSPRKGAEKVMIEGIENCKQCHSSSPKPEFADRGLQARQDCTECHGYHHGKSGKEGATTSRRPSGGFHAHQTKRLEELLGQPLRR